MKQAVLCLATTIGVAGLGLSVERAVAQEAPLQSGEMISLQKQLETGLKARRPQEFAFIQQVVLLVQQNKLPRQLVQETFVWARDQRPYPYVRFRRALQLRAARIGVQL